MTDGWRVMAKTPRMPGPIPKYAKNQTELGRYLMPPRDRKMIQRAMKLEGNPGRTPDNRYEILPWQWFVNQHFGSTTASNVPDKLSLEVERLRLQNEKLKFELQVKQKTFSSNTDIELWVGQMVMKAKRVLLAIPGKLAPQILGLPTEADVERRLRDEINAALSLLSAQPADDYVSTEAAPAAPAAPEQPAPAAPAT